MGNIAVKRCGRRSKCKTSTDDAIITASETRIVCPGKHPPQTTTSSAEPVQNNNQVYSTYAPYPLFGAPKFMPYTYGTGSCSNPSAPQQLIPLANSTPGVDSHPPTTSFQCPPCMPQLSSPYPPQQFPPHTPQPYPTALSQVSPSVTQSQALSLTQYPSADAQQASCPGSAGQRGTCPGACAQAVKAQERNAPVNAQCPDMKHCFHSPTPPCSTAPSSNGSSTIEYQGRTCLTLNLNIPGFGMYQNGDDFDGPAQNARGPRGPSVTFADQPPRMPPDFAQSPGSFARYPRFQSSASKSWNGIDQSQNQQPNPAIEQNVRCCANQCPSGGSAVSPYKF